MGDSRAYDESGYQGMGTPAYGADQAVMVVPDYLSPYDSALPQGYQMGSANPVRLMMEPVDPAGERLVIEENKSLSNQLMHKIRKIHAVCNQQLIQLLFLQR